MLTVAIASGDLTSSAQLVANLEQTGLVKSILQWSVPADRVPDSSDAMPDVVFLDLARDADPYFAFAALLRRAHPATKLIACSAISPPGHQLLLDAMRSGVQDFMPKPVSVEALADMLSRVSGDLGTAEIPSLNKLIVVMGSKGGVGTTTVTVNLGVQLATYARKKVVILDFARPLGNVHLFLDLHPRFGVRDAIDNLNRLDSHFFSGLLTQHKTKLEILGGTAQPEEWQSIHIPSLERVVNVAQNNFDVVLLDMGSQFSSEWSPILRMSRMVMIVAEANVPALWTLDRRLVALSGFGVEPERARIIINRWHKGDEEVLKSIEKSVNRPIFACIPNDFRKASEAVNLGTPLLQNHNNLLSNRYRQIAAQLSGMETGVAAKKGSLGGFFSFPTKR
ncbi:MAG TPA: AAA family ATPase [Terriglobales bacterium]|nr:AAA family ATPase [Terriglobales bacterium]